MTTPPLPPPPNRRAKARSDAHPNSTRDAGQRLFVMALLGGVTLTATVAMSSALWFERTGRQEVHTAAGVLMPPKASVWAWREGQTATLVAPLQSLAAQEDMLAPAISGGIIAITIAPDGAVSTEEGCGAWRCRAVWRHKGAWASVSWPRSLQVADSDMTAWSRRVLARWARHDTLAHGA